MKSFDAMQYLAAKCNFAHESPRPFLAVHGITQGRVCDTGCAEFQGGKCAAYRALTASATPAGPSPEPTETVREEAARRGVSISQVRRERAQRAA